MRSTIVRTVLTAAWGMSAGLTLSYGLAHHGVGTNDIDDSKPDNSPSYVTHGDAARELCGGPIVKPSNDVWATHVVVVKLNGLMVRMDIDEAWIRAESKTRADDIWVVAACKSDVGPAPSEATRDA